MYSVHVIVLSPGRSYLLHITVDTGYAYLAFAVQLATWEVIFSHPLLATGLHSPRLAVSFIRYLLSPSLSLDVIIV